MFPHGSSAVTDTTLRCDVRQIPYYGGGGKNNPDHSRAHRVRRIGMVRTGQAQSPQAIEPPQPRSGMSWWWLAPCLLAIAAFSLFWRPFWRLANASLLPSSSAGIPMPAPSQLGFSASHEGSDWRLVWN